MKYNLSSCKPRDSSRTKQTIRKMKSHVDSHHCDLEVLLGFPCQRLLDPWCADVRGCGTLRRCVLVKVVRSLGALPLKVLTCVSQSEYHRKGCHKRTS